MTYLIELFQSIWTFFSEYTALIWAFATAHLDVIIAYAALLMAFLYKQKAFKRQLEIKKLYEATLKDYKQTLETHVNLSKNWESERYTLRQMLKKERDDKGHFKTLVQNMLKGQKV